MREAPPGDRTSVPMLDLSRQYGALASEIRAAVERVFATQRFILSGEVETLERELARDLRARHAIGVSSGTDALLVALMALGVGPGDEVVVPAFTFFATAGVVARLGAKPVFSDIDAATFNLDAADFEKRISPRTRAVVPVHLYGQCADMDPILDIANRQRIAVVEDACQAIGASYRGRSAGTMGAIGAFSFYPTKNLGAAGDAGLVTTEDDGLASRLRDLRVHGAPRTYLHAEVGGNFRLDEIQAAVLNVKRPHLREWTQRRRQIAQRYRSLLSESEREGRVALPREMPERVHVYHQFVVRVAGRDAVRRRLQESGVGSGVYYPLPLHLQECFSGLGQGPGSLPEAERASREVLALPIWPEMEESEIETVARSLAEAVR
jgi:dTDP-4-amino-4,6-dideoxygalactose transaminase